MWRAKVRISLCSLELSTLGTVWRAALPVSHRETHHWPTAPLPPGPLPGRGETMVSPHEHVSSLFDTASVCDRVFFVAFCHFLFLAEAILRDAAHLFEGTTAIAVLLNDSTAKIPHFSFFEWGRHCIIVVKMFRWLRHYPCLTSRIHDVSILFLLHFPHEDYTNQSWRRW